MAADNVKLLIQALEKKHKDYSKEKAEMELFKQTYLGGNAYLQGGNLFRHGREDPGDFAERLKRAYFENFCAPIISIYTGFLCGAGIAREYGEASLESTNAGAFTRFLNDATGEEGGRSYASLISQTVSWAAAMGKMGMIVDRPTVTPGTKVLTKLDEQQLGLTTYARMVMADDILDWAYGPDGELLWVKLREDPIDMRQTFDAEEQEFNRFRVLSRNDWKVFHVSKDKKKAYVAEQGGIPIGMVPMVIFEWPQGSLIKDAAHVNRGIFNWCSLLDEVLYRQTFPQLVIPDSNDPADQRKPKTGIKTGTLSALTFDPRNPAAKPEFIAPPSSPAEVLMKQIDNGMQTIRRMLLSKADVDGAMPESGIAKGYDFAQLNNVLKEAGKAISVSDERALRIFAKWEGMNPDEMKAKYPETYDIVALADLIDNAIKSTSMRIGKIFERYMKKKVAVRMVDPRDTEDLKKIIQEIDSGSTDEKPLDEKTMFGLDENGDPIKDPSQDDFPGMGMEPPSSDQHPREGPNPNMEK